MSPRAESDRAESDRAAWDLARMPRALPAFDPPPPEPPELLQAGLVRPVAVCGQLLVWGEGIVEAAVAAGVDALHCVDIAPASDAEILRTALLLENRPGRYQWHERALLGAYLRDRVAAGDRDRLVALIEGHSDPRFLERIDCYAALPAQTRDMVDTGRIDLATARRTACLPEGWPRLLESTRPLSHSELRILIGDLEEIIRREDLGPDEARAMIVEVTASRSPLASADARRRPSIAQMRRELDGIVSKAAGDESITVEPPKDFEGECYRAVFAFGDRRTLHRKIESLRRLEKHTDELFALLR